MSGQQKCRKCGQRLDENFVPCADDTPGCPLLKSFDDALRKAFASIQHAPFEKNNEAAVGVPIAALPGTDGAR
jgi:hypothetical protein